MPAHKGHLKAGGRAKGTPNKTTQEFRETIRQLLDDNRENVSLWLAQVAEGTQEVVDGAVIGEPPNPGKALDLLAKLAEYGAPKITRAEVVPEGSVHKGAARIQIEFVNAPALQMLERVDQPTAHEVPELNGHGAGER
jgi:hypothetical protein